jgi:hypothetical protein
MPRCGSKRVVQCISNERVATHVGQNLNPNLSNQGNKPSGRSGASCTANSFPASLCTGFPRLCSSCTQADDTMPHGIGGRHGMYGWLAEMSGRRTSCQYRRDFHPCLELASSPQPLAISKEYSGGRRQPSIVKCAIEHKYGPTPSNVRTWCTSQLHIEIVVAPLYRQ